MAFIGVAALAVVDVFVAVSAQTIAVGFAISGLLYLLAPILVVRDIATRRSVERETVLGAIAAYLLVGMFFAFAYRAIGILQPAPFFGSAGDGDTAQVLFFSFVTLTTTGYGDLVPARTPARPWPSWKRCSVNFSWSRRSRRSSPRGNPRAGAHPTTRAPALAGRPLTTAVSGGHAVDPPSGGAGRVVRGSMFIPCGTNGTNHHE